MVDGVKRRTLDFTPVEGTRYALCGYDILALKDSEGRRLDLVWSLRGTFNGFRLSSVSGRQIESVWTMNEMRLEEVP